MKKNYKRLFATGAVLLCGIGVIAVVLGLLISDLSNSTIFDFLAYTILYPAIVCFIGVLIAGFINESYPISALYALVYGLIVSVFVNVVILANIDASIVSDMVSNTPSSESITITTSEPGGIGDILTSVLLFATVGAAGGLIGTKIRKVFSKAKD